MKVCLEKSIPQKVTTTYMVLTSLNVVKESAAGINLGPKKRRKPIDYIRTYVLLYHYLFLDFRGGPWCQSLVK